MWKNEIFTLKISPGVKCPEASVAFFLPGASIQHLLADSGQHWKQVMKNLQHRKPVLEKNSATCDEKISIMKKTGDGKISIKIVIFHLFLRMPWVWLLHYSLSNILLVWYISHFKPQGLFPLSSQFWLRRWWALRWRQKLRKKIIVSKAQSLYLYQRLKAYIEGGGSARSPTCQRGREKSSRGEIF